MIQFISCSLIAVIFDAFFSRMSQRKMNHILLYITVYSLTAVIICCINFMHYTVLNLSVNILLYGMIAAVMFEGSRRRKVFYLMIFFIVSAGVELIFEFFLVFGLGDSYQWYQLSDLQTFLVICFEKLLTFIILFFTAEYLKKETYDISRKLFLLSLILPAATFWIYAALFYSGWMLKISRGHEIMLITGCAMLLLANIAIFLLYDRMMLFSRKVELWKLSSLKTDMEKKYYDRMEAVNMEQSLYMHDLKFLLRTIGDLAVQEQNHEIISVIQNMNGRIADFEEEFFCRNKILNTILSEKKQEAVRQNIKYHVFVEPGISVDFIQDTDMIVIMGNMLDNALEAAAKTDQGYVNVDIFCTQKGHFLMIRIENNFNGILKEQGEHFISTKEHPEHHGMGMKNIKRCVETYGGILQIDIDGSNFTTSVIFTVEQSNK